MCEHKCIYICVYTVLDIECVIYMRVYIYTYIYIYYIEWLLRLTVRDRRRQAPSEQAYRRLKGARVCQLHVRLAEFQANA